MTVVNIHEAKTNLSKLLEAAITGEPVVIAKAGRPIAKLVPMDPPVTPRRLGFLRGLGSVPDDFDDLAADEIADLFEGRG